MSLIDLDKRHVWHPFTQMAEWERDAPLAIEAADGCELIDESGRRYIDGVASLWTNVHGHRHPAIDEAIVDQLGRVAHSTLLGLASGPAARLAAGLARHCPGSLNRVFYSESGSTAVEIALKQAYQYWALRGRPEKSRFLYLDHAYHGDTLGAVAVGGIPIFHEVFGPLLRPGIRLPSPAPCQRPGLSAPEANRAALDGLRSCLEQRAGETAALIVEPLMQGAAGMWRHPDGYLKAASELSQEHDVLLIVDEVATGFGRTGTLFACEQEDVVPDLMCLAKGLSGGYLPLAATVAKDEIYEVFKGGSERTFFHGHTYTGNGLACAAGIASLKLFEEGGVLESVTAQSLHLEQALASELEGHPGVLDIRQRGLMVGVELGDRAEGQAFHVEHRAGRQVCLRAREHGVILRNLGDVAVLMPPLSITTEQLSQIVAATRNALDALLPAFQDRP